MLLIIEVHFLGVSGGFLLSSQQQKSFFLTATSFDMDEKQIRAQVSSNVGVQYSRGNLFFATCSTCNPFPLVQSVSNFASPITLGMLKSYFLTFNPKACKKTTDDWIFVASCTYITQTNVKVYCLAPSRLQNGFSFLLTRKQSWLL